MTDPADMTDAELYAEAERLRERSAAVAQEIAQRRRVALLEDIRQWQDALWEVEGLAP